MLAELNLEELTKELIREPTKLIKKYLEKRD